MYVKIKGLQKSTTFDLDDVKKLSIVTSASNYFSNK